MSITIIGILVNGATGRIASTQHLKNALLPIRAEGGLVVADKHIVPRPLLVGRNEKRLAQLARSLDLTEWTTDLDTALADSAFPVFFDAAASHQRQDTLVKAITAGKHVYSEKPVARSVADGLALLEALGARGLKHGAVEDKQYLPGFCKLAALVRDGFFGRVVGFKLDFGWWVFDGVEQKCQRPSWNYRRSDDGGIIFDMYPHWRYVVENILGPIRRVVATAATATPARINEQGAHYAVDVEDTTATLVELDNGAIGTISSSWATRVRRDDLVVFQVDGTRGSAVAGLHRCYTQAGAHTPTVMAFNPDIDLAIDYNSAWSEVPDEGPYANPYRVGWEQFLRHLVDGMPLRSDFSAGIRDIQLAEACHRSIHSSEWVRMDQPAWVGGRV